MREELLFLERVKNLKTRSSMIKKILNGKKSPDAYRTIGEASKEIGVPTYVLRFWETKFKQVKLIKRPGGRRFYKPEDIKLLLKIKNFLKNDGLSIKQTKNSILILIMLNLTSIQIQIENMKKNLILKIRMRSLTG